MYLQKFVSDTYARSLNTLEGLLEGKNTQLVFDLHRDAVGSSNEYAPTIKINDNYVAQIMFVSSVPTLATL